MLPNVWDIATAHLLVSAGFPALGTTSLGVAGSRGLPDGVGAIHSENLRLAAALVTLPVPITVDIERGSVESAVAMAALGAAGVNIEDATGPTESMVALIRGVKREAPGLFVNARTDEHWQRTGELRETLRRVQQYEDAGADGVFVPGLTDLAALEAVVNAVTVPVNALFSPGIRTLRELRDIGVRRVSTGSLLFRAALAASVRTAVAVRDGLAVDDGLPSYSEIESIFTQ